MCNKNCNDDEEEVVTNAIINHHLPEEEPQYDEDLKGTLMMKKK